MIEVLNMEISNAPVIEAFDYPDSRKAIPQLWGDIPEIVAGKSLPSTNPTSPVPRDRMADPPATDPAVAKDLERSFEAGREQGIYEGLKREQEATRVHLEQKDKDRIVHAAKFANQFAIERDRFLQLAEKEVVRLALAIAERVLRREAQMDPLFLIGAVRVALGHLAENLHVSLRVPPAEADLWKETLSHVPNLKVRPEVIPDLTMHTGECRIESEMGSADLGLPAQLRTIQRELLGEMNIADIRERRATDSTPTEAHP
jgi:flagellar biosynthesis/type III secretory pathway protein FliH